MTSPLNETSDEMSHDRSAPSPADIGPYRLQEQIGSGGMGAVYRAFDVRLERSVALKRVNSSEFGRPPQEARRLLLAEARTVAQLSHPNVVQVYDFIEHDDSDWIVMELVDGTNLRQLLKRGSVDFADVLKYAMDICQGLSAAHYRGLVHRDLKTENIMITSNGVAKILDFGLAKWTEGDTEQSRQGFKGTPRAMAPEQVASQMTDYRADLFALGVLLYECFSGSSPFVDKGGNPMQIIWRVCTVTQQPLAERSEQIPQELSNLVDRLLEKTPERRPQSVDEVLLELQRIAKKSQKQSKRVLFVDDEPSFEKVIKRFFEHCLGHEKSTDLAFARDGVEALRLIHEDSTIDLVFTDLKMPRMDGLGLLEELRHVDRPIVAVVVSGHSDLANIRAAMNLGAFDFLTKPFDLEDFRTTLNKASHQLTSIQESQRLLAENQLLDERNRQVRLAMSRFLQRDPELLDTVAPFLDKAQTSTDFHSTLLSAEIQELDQLTQVLSPDILFRALVGFFESLIALVQRHHGVLAEFSDGQFSVCFGVAVPRRIDWTRARRCARDLRELVARTSSESQEYGGPGLSIKVVVDSGHVAIHDDSGELTNEAKSRAVDLLSRCPLNEILLMQTPHASLETGQPIGD